MKPEIKKPKSTTPPGLNLRQPGGGVFAQITANGKRSWQALKTDEDIDEPSRDHGPQPLERLMTQWRLGNHDLVAASPEQLNHKQVQKARGGRQLTLHLMQKVTRGFNAGISARLEAQARAAFVAYRHRQLFNYAKNHDPAWHDPNAAILPPQEG